MSANCNMQETIRRYVSGEMTDSNFEHFMKDRPEIHFYKRIRNAAPITNDGPLRTAVLDGYLQHFFSGRDLPIQEAGHLKTAILQEPSTIAYLEHTFHEIEAMTRSGRMSDVKPMSDTDWLERLNIARTDNAHQPPTHFPLWLKRPVYILTAAMLIAAAIFIYQPNQSPDLEITFDKSLPADYLGTLERGADAPCAVPDSFRDAFRNGMSAYLVKDYAGAHKRWNPIEADARRMALSKKELPKILRDYFLFSGLDALALAVSDLHHLDDVQKDALLDKAARNLLMAGENTSAVNYYRGLIAALRGQTEKALQILKQIPDTDPYSSNRDSLEERIKTNTNN